MNNGGAAFPRPASENTTQGTCPDGNLVIQEQAGMTLRDYFAAKALPTCITRSSYGEPGWQEEVAWMAYSMASAMLAERAKDRT